MKKEKKVTETKSKESEKHEYVEQADGVKDPVINKKQPVKTYEYEDESLKKIEEARKAFFAFERAQRLPRILVVSITLIGMIVLFIVLPNTIKSSASTAIQIVTLVIGVCIVLAYTFWTKKRLNKKMREYFRLYYEKCNEFTLKYDGITNIVYQNPDKLSKEQFTDCQVYKDIVEVGSRGLTAFEYKNIPAMVSDCAGQIKTPKRIMPVFVGKYLFAPSNYNGQDTLIIYLKGDQRALPPTNVDELKKIIDNDKMTVFGTHKNYTKYLTDELMGLVNKFKLGQDLVDLTISLTPGRCFFCMGYDDPLLVIPFDKPFNPNPITTFKNDLRIVLDIIEVLNK